MGPDTDDNKLVIITLRKTIYFEITKDVGNNLKHETEYIINSMTFPESMQ